MCHSPGFWASLGISVISLWGEREINISCYEHIGEVPCFWESGRSPEGVTEMANPEEDNTG